MVRWVRGRVRGGHCGDFFGAKVSRLRHGPSLLRDVGDTEQDTSSNGSTQPPNVIVEEAREEANEAHRTNTNEHSIDLPTRKSGWGPTKDTLFERIRKFGKIPLNIKDG